MLWTDGGVELRDGEFYYCVVYNTSIWSLDAIWSFKLIFVYYMTVSQTIETTLQSSTLHLPPAFQTLNTVNNIQVR